MVTYTVRSLLDELGADYTSVVRGRTTTSIVTRENRKFFVLEVRHRKGLGLESVTWYDYTECGYCGMKFAKESETDEVMFRKVSSELLSWWNDEDEVVKGEG